RNYEYEGLSVNILTTQKSYDLGEKVTFEVEVRPAGSYTYEWSFGDGQTATTKVPYASVTPKAGAHVLEVTVKDSSGQTARATMDYAVVDLRVTLTASASKITLGDSIKFEADVDPSGSYTYKWTFDDGYSKTTSSPSFTYTPTKAGSNGVILEVTDGSNTGLADVDFNVVSGSGSGDSSSEGGLGSMIYALIAAVIAAIVAIIGLAKKVLK
ncbi:MAG: PKD domain-containing protein, partial [Candidatus Methanomethylophilaceae archaeon]|nr:PKD domain-containing protein [Candidatus Methanomethylophilaceae archaeon]